MINQQSFRAACIQFNPVLNERQKNVDELLYLVREAAQSGAKLIVTPEMATTGYYYKDRHAIKPFVDSIPGATTDCFAAVCREYNTYVVIGMAEVDTETDLYYNSAALIGPDGYIGKYRKVHLWEWEAHWSVIGDLGFPVFQTAIGRIAINICMDSTFFESSRLVMLQGADLLAFPTNSSAQAISLLQARAEMNGLYILSANRSNSEQGVQMVGASAIWSPFGEKLVEAPYSSFGEISNEEPIIIYATIHKTHFINEAKNRIQERVPENYKELMNYIAPWDYMKNTEQRKINAAVLQCEPIIGDKEANYKKYCGLIDDLLVKQKQDIHLIVLPELATTGPVDHLLKDKITNYGDEKDSLYLQKYYDIARKYNVNIIMGFIEKECDNLYNSVLFINSSGIMEGKYQKTHLTKSDSKWAVPGSRIKTFNSEQLGKVGILIGYDAAFPEASAVLAIKRADIIIIPSLWKGEFGRALEINKKVSKNQYPEGTNSTWDAIALSCQTYVIVANPVGTEHQLGGRSALYTMDPLYGLDQPVIASANQEETLVMNFTTIQKKWWFNQEKLITLRRTNEYKQLIL